MLTWSEPKRLSHTKDESTAPAIAVTGSQVHVVWGEGPWRVSETFYRYSADGGATWGGLTRLSPQGGSMPAIFATGSEAHAAFVGWDEWSWPWMLYRHLPEKLARVGSQRAHRCTRRFTRSEVPRHQTLRRRAAVADSPGAVP